MLYSARVGLAAAALYTLSPYPVVMAGDYMPHVATLAAFVGAVALTLHGERRNSTAALVAAGALCGYAFGIRQATIVALAAPLVAAGAWRCGLRRSLAVAIPFAAGLVPLLVLFVIDNHAVTGRWWVLPHTALHGLTLTPVTSTRG